MSSGISDVLSRISQIEQQFQALTGAGSSGGAVSDTADSTDPSSSSGTSSTDFSSALAQAQASAASVTDTDDDPTAADIDSGFSSLADSSLASPTTVGSTDASDASDASGALSSLASLGGVAGTTGIAATTSSGVALPTSASTLLTSSQQQFAYTLSADTGLNPSVVSSWLLAEESGSAAQSRQAAGNNDWLNIGYTGSGTYGASDPVWSDPTTAANATAEWLQGQSSIAGYGTASSGIQSILGSVGQTPAAQITALQQSGWSSSGYPDLDSLYAQVTGASLSS